MVGLVGIGDVGSVPPPPAPPNPGQIRANRPRKDCRLELPADAWQEGPKDLMSLGDMLPAV
eukprot:10905869-Karenia_brevis.AAC.1